MPLKDALAEVCRAAKVELEIDEEGLKLAGVPADAPITVSFKDEELNFALPRILNAAQGREFRLYREMRGNKVFVSSIAASSARRERMRADLPDWLQPLYNKGVSATLDDDRNVVSVYLGQQVEDELLAKLKTLPKLRELHIETTKGFTAAGLARLAELPSLEKLQFYGLNRDGAALGNEALRVAAHLATLRSLSVAECGVTDDGLRPLEGMTNLATLRLSGNQLTDAGMKSLAGLTNLQSLDVSGSGWVRSAMRITDEGIRHLSGLTELRELSVSGLGISGSNISFPHLQSLGLSGDLATDAALDSIVQCRELRRLSLMFTRVSDEGLKKVAALKELRQLDLNSRLITDAGIACLTALPHLEHLFLRATRVSDESLRQLSQIKTLTRLDLHGSGEAGVSIGQLFTIEGLQQLRSLPNLRELSIFGLELPTGYLGFRELTQLRSLVFDFANIKPAEVELLEAAMPDTRISAMSGSGDITRGFGEPLPPRGPLPTASVYVGGRVVDEATGQAVTNAVLQFGAAAPGRPGEFIWGRALPGPVMEVAGSEPRNPSRFWGECFRTGVVSARILASGYFPQPLTPEPMLAPLHLTSLIVRLRPGGDLHGGVFDYRGIPLPGMTVRLADTPYFSIRNGVPGSLSKSNSATSDSAGRFTLPGGDGTEQRVVAASADGHLFWVTPGADPSREIMVSLPQPATLIVRYDIPGDLPAARLNLNFEPYKLDPVLWTNLSFGLNLTVTNRGEIVLTNLTPGPYRLLRGKMLAVGTGGRGGRGGRSAMLDQSSLALEGGRTHRVDLVRSTGHPLHGEVTGITQASALGAYVYAYSALVTNTAADKYRSQRPLDATTCDTNGLFWLARLEPDRYTVVAIAFKEPSDVGQSRAPDYLGMAKVTVTTNKPPDPVKLELRPYDKVLPELMAALNEGGVSARIEATNTLRQIDPSAAERAGIRWSGE